MTRKKRATREYNSFFNPWTKTLARYTQNITRSLIHVPKPSALRMNI